MSDKLKPSPEGRARSFDWLPAIALLGCIGSCSAGCGSVNPLAHKHSGSSPTPGAPTADGGSSDATAGTGPISLQLTANYNPRPVDVIVIRDGDSHAYPIDPRLQAALPLLSARLWNLGAAVGSVNIGVFDHYFDATNQNASQPQPDTVGAITDPVNKSGIFTTEGMSAEDFNTALSARIVTAGTRGGDPRPASVLLDVMTEAAKPASVSKAGNFFRPNAFWSVLYIGARLNPDDPNDQDDVLAALKAHTNGYQISALTIDKGNCTFKDLKPVQLANQKSEPQRNLELKMQAATGGVFGSVCDDSYTIFMDDFVQKGTGSQYFPITLPSAVDPASIVITGGDNTKVSDFRYVPGTTELEVSTLIQSGQSFLVQATAVTTPATAVVSTATGDPAVPVAQAPAPASAP